MKKGQHVRIYEDPYTEQKLEGTAVVKSVLIRDQGASEDGRPMTRVRVVFDNEPGETYDRWVLEPKGG